MEDGIEHNDKRLSGKESMGSIVVENIKSKNLLNPIKQTVTISGVTFTTNNDGSITLNGTATADISYIFSNQKFYGDGGNYYLGITTDYSGIGYNFEVAGYIYNASGEVAKVISPNRGTQTIATNEYVSSFNIYFKSGATFNNFTIFPQFEKGIVATRYAKYFDFECLKNNNYHDYSTASSNDNSANIYCKLFEINVTKLYQTIYVNFDVIESENAGMLFNGKILLHNNYLGQIVTNLLYGDYKLNAINGKIILYLEKNDEQNVKLSVYVSNTSNWRTFITKINSSFDSANDENSINITNNNLWQSTEPSNISKIEV